MEENSKETTTDGISIHQQIPNNFHNITCLDLSSKSLKNIDDKLVLPTNLWELNLSNNKLQETPGVILKLQHLKLLDLSNNHIEYFDETPSFCHTLEHLNLASNKLNGPPHWIWTKSPQKLTHLNLNHNINIANCIKNGYFQLLRFSNNILELNIENCRISNSNILELIGTCTKLESLYLGNTENYSSNTNSLLDLPFKGIEKCCNIVKLDASNTNIYNISETICIFKNIVELNVSYNKIHSLPNEFCSLFNLEICVLSYNKFVYLPNEMTKLTKLRVLLLDNNDLCMVPEGLLSMPNLKTLDLYNNYLNEIYQTYNNLDEFDVAQNYMDEPDSVDYVNKKNKFRLKMDSRIDGRKQEEIRSESEHSESSTDDEQNYIKPFTDNQNNEDNKDSSVSDNWDSDEYWIPCRQTNTALPAFSSWLLFQQKKMESGNFCPVESHPKSIVEQIKKERLCNPPVVYESDGQFDDYSSDNS